MKSTVYILFYILFLFNILAPWFIVVLFYFFSIHTSHALSRSSPATALLNLWLFEGKLDLPMRSICNFFFFFFFSEHKLESLCLLIEIIVYFHPIRRCYEFLDLLLQEWQTHTLERWVENYWCCIENEYITFCEVLFAQDVSHRTWYEFLFIPSCCKAVTPPFPVFVTFNWWKHVTYQSSAERATDDSFRGLNWWARDVWQPCVPAVSMAIYPRALL